MEEVSINEKDKSMHAEGVCAKVGTRCGASRRSQTSTCSVASLGGSRLSASLCSHKGYGQTSAISGYQFEALCPAPSPLSNCWMLLLPFQRIVIASSGIDIDPKRARLTRPAYPTWGISSVIGPARIGRKLE